MFRVRWERTAINQLAAAWLQGDSNLRKSITVAAHEVDRRLQYNPQDEGESREDDRRIMFVAPLAVTFRVDMARRIVSVVHIRLFRRHGM